MTDVVIASSARDLSGVQKAAALMLAVGPELAAPVLKYLNEFEVEQLTIEVATLGQLEPQVVEGILEEFQSQAVAHGALLSGGEEHARAMLRKWRGAEGDDIVDRLLASVRTTPFHFVRLHDPDVLVQHLGDEHPQTIALILAHLPAKFAAAVLAGFEAGLQTEVAMRIATMESADPKAVARVEAALQARLGSQERRGTRTKGGGVKELANLLNNSDRSTEKSILQSLETSDPTLAEDVRSLMFVFEDVVTLDDRAIQETLRNVDGKQLALALKGVRPDVNHVITRNMSTRAMESLDEDMQLLGPVRASEVEAAQSDVVRIIRRLEEEGTIVVSRGGDSALIE